MKTPKRALRSLAFLCLALGTIHASATELLYTLSGTNGNVITTYSVNTTTAATKALGTVTIPSVATRAILRAPNTPFLYVLGHLRDNSEHIWTYKLNALGVPAALPIQNLPVKNALITLIIHPSGKFAYAYYSWTAPDPKNPGTTGYVADITLFTINAKTGLMINTKKAVANWTLDDTYQTGSFALNTKGTEMYIKLYPFNLADAPVYYQHGAINTSTGAIATPTFFWNDPPTDGATGVGDIFLARSEPDTVNHSRDISIYPNVVNPNALIRCTLFMLAACGDSTYNMMFDPTGKYLLFNDSTINQLFVTYVSAPKTLLIESGAVIPGLPYLTTFSPSGLMLYAVESGQVLVFVFSPHTGLLTAKTTISDPNIYKLTPAK